ncbi:EthD domain-containing protein [Myxococcota bacterium]|nr:EthD domain-containing protein [Myxococcota bacterium]
MSTSKWLRCFQNTRDPHDPDAALAAAEVPETERRVIDVVDPTQKLLELHGPPARRPVRYALLSWEWWNDRPQFDNPREFGYRLSERPVFDELPPFGEDGWRPGVKQLFFLYRPPGLSRQEFRERYHHHTETLRADQPGIAKYVQNVAEEAAPGAPEIDGVSELWFASLDDYQNRYWSGPGVAEREAKQTGRFLDFTRTWSLLVRERKSPTKG